MRTALLLTENGLELPCVVLSEHNLPLIGKETLVYCQSRLVKCLCMDEDYMIELKIVVNWCMAPELDEILYEIQSSFEM